MPNTIKSSSCGQWACVCIILHNLIICIEANNFNKDLRKQIRGAGLDCDDTYSDTDEDNGLKDMLKQMQQQLKTSEQHFKIRLMDNLFNSPSYAVECCP